MTSGNGTAFEFQLHQRKMGGPLIFEVNAPKHVCRFEYGREAFSKYRETQ